MLFRITLEWNVLVQLKNDCVLWEQIFGMSVHLFKSWKRIKNKEWIDCKLFANNVMQCCRMISANARRLQQKDPAAMNEVWVSFELFPTRNEFLRVFSSHSHLSFVSHGPAFLKTFDFSHLCLFRRDIRLSRKRVRSNVVVWNWKETKVAGWRQILDNIVLSVPTSAVALFPACTGPPHLLKWIENAVSYPHYFHYLVLESVKNLSSRQSICNFVSTYVHFWISSFLRSKSWLDCRKN